MYDSTTANPVNPQGTAGGGNGFNIGSLFGEGSFFMGAAPANSGAASTTSTDTAAATGGTAVPTLGPSSVGGASSNGWLWAGIIGAGVLGLVSLFRRRKAA